MKYSIYDNKQLSDALRQTIADFVKKREELSGMNIFDDLESYVNCKQELDCLNLQIDSMAAELERRLN